MNNNNLKVFIVIPAFNEARMIGSVIEDIKKEGFNNIIVVDDGSKDNTYEIAKDKGVIALKHIINRGKGAATQTGLDAAKLMKADITVTIDADGQHLPSNIKTLVDPIINDECDVSLGSRLIKNDGMPLLKHIINFVGNLITYFFYGILVTDSQSGFRAYNAKANALIETTMDRYEFESEILHQVKDHNLKYKEFPISVRYTDYSKTKYNDIKYFQAQSLFNGFNMLFKMIIKSITR